MSGIDKGSVVVLIIFHLSGVSGKLNTSSFNTTPFESMNFIKTGIGFPVVFIYLKRRAYTCANPVETFHSILLPFSFTKKHSHLFAMFFLLNLPFSTAVSASYDILTRAFLSSEVTLSESFPLLLYPPFPNSSRTQGIPSVSVPRSVLAIAMPEIKACPAFTSGK